MERMENMDEICSMIWGCHANMTKIPKEYFQN